MHILAMLLLTVSVISQAGRDSNLSHVYESPGYANPPLYNRTWHYKYPDKAFSCDKVVLVSLRRPPGCPGWGMVMLSW